MGLLATLLASNCASRTAQSSETDEADSADNAGAETHDAKDEHASSTVNALNAICGDNPKYLCTSPLDGGDVELDAVLGQDDHGACWLVFFSDVLFRVTDSVRDESGTHRYTWTGDGDQFTFDIEDSDLRFDCEID